MMNYKVVDQPLQNRSYSDLIINCKSNKDLTELNFLAKEDYRLIGCVDISEETFVSSISKGDVILYHFNKPGYYKVGIETKNKLFVQKDDVPEYVWKSGVVLFLDRVNRLYKCISDNKKEVFSFIPKYPISNQWFKYGVLFFQNNEKVNNWIKCLDPRGGQEIWKIEFPWQFVRLETYERYIIIDYHAYDNLRKDEVHKGEIDWYNPHRYTIVISGDTGSELWRRPFAYSKIDFERGVVLSGSDTKILEVDIRTGDIKSDLLISLPADLGYNPHFTDDVGIYYLTHDHSFGKVSKSDGTILWEFDLIDENGEKRKLSDWLLLGNGNLVLQAMPNHSNGKLTCVFSPEENLQFSKVKDGERSSPDYV